MQCLVVWIFLWVSGLLWVWLLTITNVIKWSLMSAITVQLLIVWDWEWTRMWSIRVDELPCILVMWEIHWAYPWEWIFKKYSELWLVCMLMFESRQMYDELYNDDKDCIRFSNWSLNCSSCVFWVMDGGGLGDLYTEDTAIFLSPNLTSIKRHSKIFCIICVWSVSSLYSMSSWTKSPTPPPLHPVGLCFVINLKFWILKGTQGTARSKFLVTLWL